MDVTFTEEGPFIGSFATGRIPVKPMPLETLARRHPEATVYNLLARCEQALKKGHQREADALAADAERMFRIAVYC